MIPAIEELSDFVRLPNDAINADDIAKNIAWTEKAFERRGFDVAVLPTGRLPVMLMEKRYSSASKTVLFYFHLDGQAARAGEWSQENPFEPVLKQRDQAGEWQQLDWESLHNREISDEWRLFGRSASDDKGPMIMFLQAMDLLAIEKKTPPFNIKVVVDCEEEKGSPGLKGLLAGHAEKLVADYMIVMDGPMHSSNLPTLTFGCRGGTGFSLTTFGAISTLHSGHFGNYSPDPGFSLATIIASMKDEKGRVLIKGFYDGITFDEESVRVMASVPDDPSQINRQLQIAAEEKVGNSYQEAMQFPSLNIRGLKAAVVGPEGGSVIPDQAIAEFGIRLVPETEGSRMIELVRSHIRGLGFHVADHLPTAEERMRYPKLVFMNARGAGTPAFRTDIHSPIGKWLRKSVAGNFGRQPVIIRMMGGSVPVVPFIRSLNIPAVIVPLVNMDNNQHAPDENLRLGNLRSGIKLCLSILTTPITDI